jgi:all-trans-retinol 13,14-reductase
MNNDVVIIGGGIGGLFTGALLAKEGYKVTVLERSAHVGGGLQSFTRNGVSFDAGMHVVGGLQPGGSLNRICRHLGILDRLHFRQVDADCGDEVFCFEDGRTYRIPQGKEPFTEYIQQMFPEERENIRRYVDHLFALADQVDFFFLRPGSGATTGDETFYQSSSQFIADHVRDPRLRSLLAYLSPLCGGEAGYTPAYIFALINYLYISGHSRFEGPAEQLAEALVRRIGELGGEVQTNAEVTDIRMEGGRVQSLSTADGRVFEADVFISSIHPQAMLKIVNNQLFTKAARTRLSAAPNNYSAYCV